jgi:hypothetical protein
VSEADPLHYFFEVAASAKFIKARVLRQREEFHIVIVARFAQPGHHAVWLSKGSVGGSDVV